MRILDILTEAKKKKKKATKTRLDPKCWKGKKIGKPKTKVKGGVRVNNCVPKESLKESITPISRAAAETIDLNDPKNKQLWLRYGHYTPGDWLKEFPSLGEYNAKMLANYAEAGWVHGPYSDESKQRVVYHAKQLIDNQESSATNENILHRAARWISKKLSDFAGIKDIDYGRYVTELPNGQTIMFEISDKGLWVFTPKEMNAPKLRAFIERQVKAGHYSPAPNDMQRAYMQSLNKPKPPPSTPPVNTTPPPAAPTNPPNGKNIVQFPKKENQLAEGDVLFIEAGDTLIETTVVYESNGRIVVELDDTALNLIEAKYHGRTVPLGKPMKGDVKKSKVYVRKPNGNIVKVNFGDKKMRIKKSNPKRRKSFRARHNCKSPGPRWKARYWSCRAW